MNGSMAKKSIIFIGDVMKAEIFPLKAVLLRSLSTYSEKKTANKNTSTLLCICPYVEPRYNIS